jgi:hypothetical protein
MKLSIIFLIGFLLIIPMQANAQSASGQCGVYASSWDKRSKLGSGLTHLGDFNPLVANMSTFKAFKAYDDLIVTVGVEYVVYREPKDARFQEVHLMITASNKEAQNIFGLVESSEASTALKKRWYLTVSKRIEDEDKVYTFTLRCWDNVKFPR